MDAGVLAGLILVAGIALLLLIGAPISIAVGLASTLAMFVVVGAENGALTSAQQMFRGINSFALLAIPFFVLAGVIMSSGGIAMQLINAGKVLVGRVPGSSAQTTVAANTLFGAVSGSSIAAAAAIGTTMGPVQAKEGYDRNFSAAVNVASAPGGMLVPPSNLMIVYSLVSGTSVAALFMAGYLPGILWAIACSVIVYLYARKRPELKETQRIASPREPGSCSSRRRRSCWSRWSSAASFWGTSPPPSRRVSQCSTPRSCRRSTAPSSSGTSPAS